MTNAANNCAVAWALRELTDAEIDCVGAAGVGDLSFAAVA